MKPDNYYQDQFTTKFGTLPITIGYSASVWNATNDDPGEDDIEIDEVSSHGVDLHELMELSGFEGWCYEAASDHLAGAR